MSTAAAGRLATFRRIASQSGTLWACALACDRALPFETQRLWPPIRVPAESTRMAVACFRPFIDGARAAEVVDQRLM